MLVFTTSTPYVDAAMNHPLLRAACVALLVLVPVQVQSASVLSEVPSDALGFAIVHNLSAVDTKVGQLMASLQRSIPRPLAFLKEFAGIADGLNPEGDFLLVLLPSTNGDSQELVYCVWLPVADYDRFLSSVGATSLDGVAAATIAGEDLLVARRGNWALIMDPDQRDRIAQMAAAPAAPPEMPSWSKWIETNDVTTVALQPGLRAIAAMMGEESAAETPPTANPNGSRARNTNPIANRPYYLPGRRVITFSDLLEMAKGELQKWSAAMPELPEAMKLANTVGCGLRLDASGNAQVGFRLAFDKATAKQLAEGKRGDASALPPSVSASGGFVLSGAGQLPGSVLSAYVKGYVRRTAADMKAEEETELDETAVKRLLEASEVAAADVQSFHFISQPGDAAQPTYSNEFLVLRVDSSSKFVEHAKEVMRLWNSANRSAKGENRLIFDVAETKLGDIAATLYWIDMVALQGGLILPELRQQMEKLFGPEGKMRLWIVPTDDSTILIATATPDQMTEALKVLGEKQPINWNRVGLREVNALLPAESDWRVFVDGNRYIEWQRREEAAVAGVPIIGATLVRDFPPSPPAGFAGGLRDGELWFDVAALPTTLKSVDMYLTRNRSRAAVQFRARAIAPAPVPVPAPAPKK